jgi:hypothetical protein
MLPVLTVSIYQEIKPTLSFAKKSYASMVTKSSLEAKTISFEQKPQILAGMTGTGPLMGVPQPKFIAIALATILHLGNFSAVSYHRRSGVTIAAVADLCPTQNQTAANRHPSGIMFARLACDLCLTKVNNENKVDHPFTYFICLPNSKEEVINSTSNEAQLNSFHSPDD